MQQKEKGKIQLQLVWIKYMLANKNSEFHMKGNLHVDTFPSKHLQESGSGLLHTSTNQERVEDTSMYLTVC